MYDDEGNRYEITNHKEVNSCNAGGNCSYVEATSFFLTREQIEKFSKKTPNFRLKGAIDFDFLIPNTYFAGFLGATDNGKI